MCVCRGVPDHIHEWYQMTVAMVLKLNWHKKRSSAEKKSKSQTEKHQLGYRSSPRQAEGQPKGTSGQPIKCFHYGQQDHRVAGCLVPAPIPTEKTLEPAKLKKPPRKAAERGKFTRQAVEVFSPQKEEEGTPAQGLQVPVAYKSCNENEDDLIPSNPSPSHPD